MLLEIRLSNTYSIDKEVIIDFRAANLRSEKAKALTDNIYEWQGQKILKTLAIYGANASGKSNIIKSIRNFCNTIIFSHNFNQNSVLPAIPFKFAKKKHEPSSFFIRFVSKEIEYEYSILMTQESIIHESLYHYPKGHRAKIFSRNEAKELEKDEIYSFSDKLLKPIDVAINTSIKTLYLSRAAQMDREWAKELYAYFSQTFLLGFVQLSADDLSELFIKNKEMILQALSHGDSDIVDIKMKKETLSARSISFNIPANTSEFTEGPLEHVRFITKHKPSNEVEFDLESEESDGTKQLFEIILRLVDVFHNQKSLLLDEFDSSLHSKLAEFVLNFFHASERSQFLFTTHNTNLIDMNLLRRDQIIFVNKNEKGASEVYSLFDYKEFRENMDAEKGYLEGRFDAIPFVNSSVDYLKKTMRAK